MRVAHEPGDQVLPGRVRSAREGHIFATGGSPCLAELRLDAAGDEGERRSALELERGARVVREHEQARGLSH
jgi:hypothetical protein